MAKQNLSDTAKPPVQRASKEDLKLHVIQIEKALYAAEFKLDYAPNDFYQMNEYFEVSIKYQISLTIEYFLDFIGFIKHRLHEKAPEIVKSGLSRLTSRLESIILFLNSIDKTSTLGTAETDFLRDIAFDLKSSLDKVGFVSDYIEYNYLSKFFSNEAPDIDMNVTKRVKSRSFDEEIENLLLKEDVPSQDVDLLVEIIKYEIRVSKARHLRPKWKDRSEHGLDDLTALNFLRTFYAENIEGDIFDKEYIRSIDKDLVDAVDAYVSQREERGQALGWADDLKFVSSRTRPDHRPEVHLKEKELVEFRMHAKKHPWVAGNGLSPSAFIAETFKQWLGKGLLREHIKEALPKLASAYSAEVNRHPDRRLPGLGTRPHTRHGSLLEGEKPTSSGWIKNEDLHPDQVAARRRALAIGRRPAKTYGK